MVTGDDTYWAADLDDEASHRGDQASFHVFAEGQHSDSRGQIYNLAAGSSLALPHDRWPDHLFIVLGVRGSLDATVATTTIRVKPLSQLVVLPGVACTLSATSDASVELLSFRSARAGIAAAQSQPAARIASAGNVLVPAIKTLELRGFIVTRHLQGETEAWRASRANFEALGIDPLELLALVAILESRGSNWQASDSEIADVMRRFDLG